MKTPRALARCCGRRRCIPPFVLSAALLYLAAERWHWPPRTPPLAAPLSAPGRPAPGGSERVKAAATDKSIKLRSWAQIADLAAIFEYIRVKDFWNAGRARFSQATGLVDFFLQTSRLSFSNIPLQMKAVTNHALGNAGFQFFKG